MGLMFGVNGSCCMQQVERQCKTTGARFSNKSHHPTTQVATLQSQTSSANCRLLATCLIKLGTEMTKMFFFAFSHLQFQYLKGLMEFPACVFTTKLNQI